MHLHVIVRTTTDLLRGVSRGVAAIAEAYEFGRECDVKLCDQGGAWYLAKYAKTADERQWVPWPDRDGVVTLGAPRMRGWLTSRGWGLTMKELRALQAGTAGRRTVEGGAAGEPAEGPATGRAGVACLAPQAPGSSDLVYRESSRRTGVLGFWGAT